MTLRNHNTVSGPSPPTGPQSRTQASSDRRGGASRELAYTPLLFAIISGFCQIARCDDAPPAQTPRGAGSEPTPAQQRTVGPVRIEKFGRLRWSLDTGALHARGSISVLYTEPDTHVQTVLTATDLDYDATTARIRSPGVAEVVRPDGRFRGSNVDFNLRTNTGRLENATVASDYFRMTGDLIERRADGTYHLVNGEFTTCIRGTPDYLLRASDLTVNPNTFVKAHNVRLFLGGFGFPAIPYLSRGLGSGAGFPLPTPGYDRTNGFAIRLADNPVERPNESLDYDIRVNFRRVPTGFGVFQRDIESTPTHAPPPRILLPTFSNPLSGILELITPPTYNEYAVNRYNVIAPHRTTFFATIQNDQLVYNRRRNDLQVSRLPEVGVQFLNMLGAPSRTPGARVPDASSTNDGRPTGVGEAARYRAPDSPGLLNVTVGLGEFLEDPTHVSAGRVGLRANFASQPVILGRRLSARAGFSEFVNLYTTGSVYNMMMPEAELDLVPTRDSLFDVAYRYVVDAGNTPFTFDRRDIRHELRLQYQVSGPWAFAIASKIDLERARAYDGEVAVARNFDCMQVGVAYRLRSQSFNVNFILFPPRRDRSRPLIPLRTRPARTQP